MSPKATFRSMFVTAMMLGAAFCVPNALAQSQAGTWSKMAPLPHALDEQQAITVNGKIYLVGGAWDERNEGKTIEHYDSGFMTEYDPQTNQWRERAKGPEGLTHQGIALLNGKIYLAGGFAAGHHTEPSASVFSYDPATDKWQKLASLSDVRGAIALAAVGGKIHAVGGRLMGEMGTLSVHEVYDPATNKWTKAAPPPTARDHAGIFVVDGKIHLIGGRTGEASENTALHDIYDPATDSWKAAAPMPTPRSSVAFAEYHGLLFVAGGECLKGKAYDQVEAYDLKADRWVTFPAMPSGRHGFAAAAAGDKLFFMGGSTRCGGGGKIADNLQFTPG